VFLHRDIARDLLDKGVKREGGLPEFTEPIIAAIHQNDVQMVHELLARGVKPDDPTRHREPAIVAASQNTSVQRNRWTIRMIDLLLAHGADVNAADPDSGQTAIFNTYDNPQLLAALISRGARTNIRDRSGLTPLHTAHDVKTARMFLDRGADPNVADSTGSTPLMNAVRTRNLDLVRLLVSHGAKPDASDRFGNSAISIAQQSGWTQGVDALKARKSP
jgi:ankyrin repeat protein